MNSTTLIIAIKSDLSTRLLGKTITFTKPDGTHDVRNAFDLTTAVLDSGENYLKFLLDALVESIATQTITHIQTLGVVSVTSVSLVTPGIGISGPGVGTIS
jgi:hypothetical protein